MIPKFTLITHDYPPAHGGVARYLSSLAKAAKGQIDVLVPLGLANQIEIQDTEYKMQQVRFWWRFWPRWIPLIKRCLEVPEDQIILISHVFPIGTAAWIAKKLGASNYAIIFHGTDLKRAQTKWKRWLLQRICKNADFLIVNSEATKKILTRLVPTADPIKLTPAIEYFNLPEKALTRDELNVAKGTKVILAVSRLVERKGIDTLIQAVSNIDNNHIELVVIGDGEFSAQLHNLAELSKVSVRWINKADDQTLHDWYAAADIFCLPGRETLDDVEGFGIVFLEAAYAGLPVIAGESGGTKEAVVNNETGLLIQPNVEACTEALSKLISDPKLAEDLGTAGHNRVINDFDWDTRWEILTSKVTNQPTTLDVRRSTLNISAVIPCYNHAKELAETLESIVNQSVKVKEVIVVDDGSNDNPEKVADTFKDSLPIQFIKLDKNSGAPTARNRGAKASTGEFIIFLDADAILVSSAFADLHQALVENPTASFAYSDFIWGKRLFKGKKFSSESLKQQNYIHTSALIRKSD